MRLLGTTWSFVPVRIGHTTRLLPNIPVRSTLSSNYTYGLVRPLSTPASSRRQKADGGGGGGDWETVIGLEIHAQIKTPRKLFSRSTLGYADPPNTNIDLLDAALPGSLPVLNYDAVRLALLTSLALKCDINTRSTFDRKHYFYHDIPASYQITQHYNPLARNGRLQIAEGENGSQRSFEVGIQQLQIEQDTAKSQLVGDDTLVDLNRAGSALMEIVTDPDMRSPEEAGAFVKKLQGLLRRIGSGDGDMEKGNLRIDANVSVNRSGAESGVRCEIKNLNSVRFLQQAIRSERARHIAHYLSDPETALERETRGMNEVTGQTYSLRSKEDAVDYRYMPDPNLPAMVVDEAYLKSLEDEMPEMPWETVDRLVDTYNVLKKDVETLISLDESGGKGIRYFDEIVGQDVKIGKKALNWIVNDLLGQLHKSNQAWSPEVIPSSLMRDLILAIESNELKVNQGKAIIRHFVDNPSMSRSPVPRLSDVLSDLGISTKGLTRAEVERLCLLSIRDQPKVVSDYMAGNQAAIGRLIGDAMKRSKGRADPKEIQRVLRQLLSE